jgi:hypothetical protein
MNNSRVIVLELDPFSGEVILPLPDDILETLGCVEGDTVNFIDNEDGSFTISKATSDITIPDKSWNAQDKIIFKNWLRNLLFTQQVTVYFTKKDGTERKMICTLNPDVLPKREVNENKKERIVSENIVAVYDVEAEGWRSFNIDSVNRVEYGTN